MQFRSAHFNARYVMMPEDLLRDQYGRVVQQIPGRVAQFRGAARIWDSEQAQAQYGWTDEERIQMERWLLSHPEFNQMHVFDMGGTEDRPLGNGALPMIGLAPGQLLPKEHEEFCKSLKWYQAKQSLEVKETDIAYCAATIQTPDGVINCPRKAEVGAQYCLVHEPELAVVDGR